MSTRVSPTWSKTACAVRSGTTTVRPSDAPSAAPLARIPTTSYSAGAPAPSTLTVDPIVRPSCGGEALVDQRARLVGAGQRAARDQRQVVESRLGGRVDAEDRDRRREPAVRGRALDVGPPFEGRRDDRDARRGRDRRVRLLAQASLAEGGDAQVGPSDERLDRAVRRCGDAVAGRQRPRTGPRRRGRRRRPSAWSAGGARAGCAARAGSTRTSWTHGLTDRAGRAGR